MNWIEILRLIVQIWPLIERILEMISNAEVRDTATNEVKEVVVSLITGTMPVSTSNEVIAALAKPLQVA